MDLDLSNLPLATGKNPRIFQPKTPPRREPKDQRLYKRGSIRPMALTAREARKADESAPNDPKPEFNLADPDEQLDPDTEHALRPYHAQDHPSLPETSTRDIARRMFRRAFAEAQASLNDLTPYRTRAAYRITRELARHLTTLTEDQSLMEGVSPEQWHTPMQFTQLPDPSKPHSYSAATVKVLLRANQLQPPWLHQRLNSNGAPATAYPGLSLLPPHIPAAYQLAGNATRPEYDPHTDHALLLFIDLVQAISSFLYIEQGSLDDPDMGRYGLLGLQEPDLIRLAYPSQSQIMACEQIMVEETLRLLIDNGIIETRSILYRKYGLREHETLALVKMARVHCKPATEGDIAEDRALMILKIEDYCRRSREALNLDTELRGLKQLGLIQGLTKSDAEDPLKDFIAVARKVHEDRKSLPRDDELAKIHQ